MQRERRLESNLERKIGDAMNKEARRGRLTARTIPARLSCVAPRIAKTHEPPRSFPARVEGVTFVVDRAVTTRILRRGECTRPAGGVKEACSL